MCKGERGDESVSSNESRFKTFLPQLNEHRLTPTGRRKFCNVAVTLDQGAICSRLARNCARLIADSKPEHRRFLQMRIFENPNSFTIETVKGTSDFDMDMKHFLITGKCCEKTPVTAVMGKR